MVGIVNNLLLRLADGPEQLRARALSQTPEQLLVWVSGALNSDEYIPREPGPLLSGLIPK